MAPIAQSSLQFVVNANWPLFFEQASSNYYLFDGKGWQTSKALQGPWNAASQLPKDMSKVPQNANFADLKSFIPPPAGSAATAPMVYYSANPAEIDRLQGTARVGRDSGNAAVVRVEHRQPRIQVRTDGSVLLPDFGTLVYFDHAAARTLDVRDL